MSWLIHSKTVYPQSGHLSTIDRAQVKESLPAKDRLPNYSATPPNIDTNFRGISKFLGCQGATIEIPGTWILSSAICNWLGNKFHSAKSVNLGDEL